MRKLLSFSVIIAGLIIAMTSAQSAPIYDGAASSETNTSKPSKAEPVKLLPKSDYSRWSVGANIGTPFFWGDFKSFSSDKTYFGIGAGLNLGYQIIPLLGVSVSADYLQGKIGCRDYAKGYFLDKTGYTYYTTQTAATAKYDDLYANVRGLSFGIGLDFNLLRLFDRNPDRRFSVILTPEAWLQKYFTGVYLKNGDSKFVDNAPDQDWNAALGGSASLRYRVSKVVDIQLRNTFAYIYNNNFDGIRTHSSTRQNLMWEPQLGVIIKLGNCPKAGTSKVDNLMYYGKPAPAPVIVPQPAPKPEPAPVKEEPKVEPAPAPAPAPQPAPVAEPAKVVLPTLPSIYFAFDSWSLKGQYSKLKTIADTLGKYPDYDIQVNGYGDRHGSAKANRHVSTRRATAVKSYLVRHGIPADRIKAKGFGSDRSTSSDKARRVETIIVEK
jgi:outer membrane protein OmpA-like peptidoglycan-associated protein